MSQILKNLLVPLDGSDLAEEALAIASKLASAHNADLHLVSVVPYVPPVSLAPSDEARRAEWIDEERGGAAAYLESAASKVFARSPEVSVTSHALVGPVGPTIQTLVDDQDIDLVVLTTHGRGAFQRSWLGSTADQLVRSVERPLLVLRHREGVLWSFDPDTASEVLVPLDGSEAAESALEAIPLVLSPQVGARLLLTSVIDEGYPLPPVYIPKVLSEEALRKQHRRETEAYLQKVADRLDTDASSAVETRVIVDDDPGRALLRFCDEVGVHLVAISTHGRGGVSRFFLGSVADKLLREAPVPVLVTKRPSPQ